MKIISKSPEETMRIAEKIARRLKAGDTIALIGELGSGKTVFAKGIARGLGVKDSRHVNSPSFVIIKEYRGAIPLYHIDVYRLGEGGSCDTIPYDEYFFGGGVTVVEWADKIVSLLPKEYLKIELVSVNESTRRLIISGYGKRFTNILKNVSRAQ